MNFFKKYRILISLLIITALGLYLRLRIINNGDFWLDEAFTGIFVRANLTEMFRMIVIDFVHPPLYYIAVKLWTELFNSTSVFTLRLFSVFFGTILIPLSYVFMNTLFKGKKKYISLLTAFVFSINPFFVSYSLEVRAYALLAVLGILTALFFLKLLKEKKIQNNKHYLVFVILSLLLVSTHYISAIFLFSLGVAYLIIKPKSFESFKDTLKLFLPSVITVGILVTGFLFVRERFVPGGVFSVNNIGWIPKVSLLSLPISTYNFIFGVQSQNMGVPPSNTFIMKSIQPQFIAIFIFFILILSLVLSFRKKFNKENLKFLLSISLFPIIFVGLLSFLGIQMYIERYMIIFGLGLILLIMYLLSKSSILVSGILISIYALLLFFITPTVPITRYSDICTKVNGSNLLVDDPSEYLLIKYYCDRSNVLLFTDNREFYKKRWLIIGYENTVDMIGDESNYLIKKNEIFETESKWNIIKNNEEGIFQYLKLYKTE